MPDQTNLISAELTAEQQTESLSLLDRLRGLFGFLITIPDKEKRYLLYPGLKGMEACQLIYDLVSKYRDHFPKAVLDSLPELARDLLLAKALRPVHKTLLTLAKGVEDTLTAARSDAYRTALEAYIYAKPMTKSIPGLEEELAPLRAIFDRPNRRPTQADAE